MENMHTRIEGTISMPKGGYKLKEIYINPEHVVMMREDRAIAGKISKHQLSEDLHPEQEFTTLRINSGNSGINVTIIGSLTAVQEKLNLNNKQLLKG